MGRELAGESRRRKAENAGPHSALATPRRCAAGLPADMKSPAPTVRSLARALGLSHTTVSDALRGKGRVDPATVARVQKAAREAGYHRNPLAAAVMSELRRSRGGTFRGVLAAVDLSEPTVRPMVPFIGN
jgi:predicted GNAT family acetyltransferase